MVIYSKLTKENKIMLELEYIVIKEEEGEYIILFRGTFDQCDVYCDDNQLNDNDNVSICTEKLI